MQRYDGEVDELDGNPHFPVLPEQTLVRDVLNVLPPSPPQVLPVQDGLDEVGRRKPDQRRADEVVEKDLAQDDGGPRCLPEEGGMHVIVHELAPEPEEDSGVKYVGSVPPEGKCFLGGGLVLPLCDHVSDAPLDRAGTEGGQHRVGLIEYVDRRQEARGGKGRGGCRRVGAVE